MQAIYQILIFVLVGGLIGYFTNTLAIYMLFHPRKSLLGIQGIIPKRKDKLAEKISENIHFVLPPIYKKIISIPFLGEGINVIIQKSIMKTIQQTSERKIEQIIKNVVRKELRFIEILGGIVGMLIGLIQGIIFLILI
jgi:uncharacterized membrane protein YheB (UPF0754 family)